MRATRLHGARRGRTRQVHRTRTHLVGQLATHRRGTPARQRRLRVALDPSTQRLPTRPPTMRTVRTRGARGAPPRRPLPKRTRRERVGEPRGAMPTLPPQGTRRSPNTTTEDDEPSLDLTRSSAGDAYSPPATTCARRVGGEQMTNEPNFDNFLFAGERIRFCAHCTVMLVSTGRGRPPRYCSDECRREHERERERRRNVHLRPCRQCGTVFRTQHGALYCSPECKQAGNRERQRRRPVRHNPRLCAWCGATYRPTKRNARYCGRACKREHEAHCYHERQRPERERRVAERELEREARRAIADVQRLIRDECSRRACDECGTA